jgi:hypothetical protein
MFVIGVFCRGALTLLCLVCKDMIMFNFIIFLEHMCEKVIDLIVHQFVFASFELQNVCLMLHVESGPKGEVVGCFDGTT